MPREVGQAGVLAGDLEVYHRKGDFVLGAVRFSDEVVLKALGTLSEIDQASGVPLAGIIEVDLKRGGIFFRIRGAIDRNLDGAAARAYLGSGLVSHVGPAIAEEIVGAFADETMDVLLWAPERLVGLRGLTAPMLPAIRASLSASLPFAGIVGLLGPFGISVGVCRQVAKRYGAQAVAEIVKNPWQLATEFTGVGFRAADAIALRLGHAPDSPARFEAALLYVVSLAVRDGHTIVARSAAVADTAELLEADRTAVKTALERLIDRAALSLVQEYPADVARPDLARAESFLADAFSRLLARPADDDILDEAAIDALGEQAGLIFDPTQRTAIANALERGLTVLTGGPGTGKTTIVRAICDLAEARDLKFALVSFTGKAAKRLSEATGRPASTIHRYLRATPGGGFSGPESEDDIVIVDEVSMLDVLLAQELVSWLAPGARLILVGDVDQLPAIGPGNVLGDLVETARVPVFRLSIIHRTDAESGIPRLARAINEGSTDLPFDGRTTRFTERADGNAVAEGLAEHFTRYRERAEEFQVLTPIKAGPAGAENLNGVISRALRGDNPRGRAIVREHYEMRAGDRIIWTVNDRDLGLFNGEIGTLIEVTSIGGAIVEFNGEHYKIGPERVMADIFSLSYALTVHKAQGSEFPIVLVVVDAGAHVMLARRLLYTAVSRARDTVAILGQPAALARAVRHHEALGRRTALGALLGAAQVAQLELEGRRQRNIQFTADRAEAESIFKP